MALGVAAVSAALLGDVAGARDFRPFTMTIEYWNAEAIGFSDGRRLPRTDTYRLEYWDRRNWTMRQDGPEPGQVTYTDPGERIVFDLRTGLPVVYEAGLTTGPAKVRETYLLERFFD